MTIAPVLITKMPRRNRSEGRLPKISWYCFISFPFFSMCFHIFPCMLLPLSHDTVFGYPYHPAFLHPTISKKQPYKINLTSSKQISNINININIKRPIAKSPFLQMGFKPSPSFTAGLWQAQKKSISCWISFRNQDSVLAPLRDFVGV